MAKNKIIYGNETLIDLTSDTVSPSTLLSGETAHDRSGEAIVGTATVPDELNDLDDVNISSPTGGQALIYDSQNDEWVNGTVSGTDGVDWTSFNYLGAKNLNSTPYYHDSGRTSYGITFTVSDDGIVTANGTVDDDEWAYYRCHSHEYDDNALILPNGTYILSGCPTNTDSYWIEALVLSSQTEVSLGQDFGNGCTITLTGSDDTPTGYTRLGITIFLDENVTATNLQFKPMVRLSSVVDDTWTPYALTNRELTEKIGDASDSNVYQKNTTNDNDYRVLLSHSDGDTDETDYVRKSSALQFNNGEGLTVDTRNTSNVIQSSKVIVGNNIADGVTGTTYGKLRLYGQGTYYTDIGDMNGVLTANRELSLPNDSGTLAIKDDIPTKVSDLQNDSGFIDNTVNNLTNYYLKTDTYTQAEVNALIGSITTISFLVVQTLPSTGESNIIYLVPKTTAGTDNVYDEYIYVNNDWELIGDTEVDLSNYYTKTQTENKIDEKINALDVTGSSNISASKTIKSWSETDGKVNVTTQDIQIAESQVTNLTTDLGNKVSKTGDTMTGQLIVTGTASDKPIKARGVVGISSTGSIEDALYLQYGNSQSDTVYFGETAGGKIHTNGTKYNGTAANAEKVNNLTVQTAVPANAVFTDENVKVNKIDDTNWHRIPVASNTDTSETINLEKSPGLQFVNTPIGTTETAGNAYLAVGNNKATGTADNYRGRLRLYDAGTYRVDLYTNTLTADRNINLPNDGGTVALTKNIPTKVSDLTNDSGFSSVSANPATTTETLTGLEIDGTGYAITANTAAKLSTARAINLGRDLTGTANFDGSSDITINANFYSCNANGGNKANYPWHRIAKIENVTGTYNDRDAIFLIRRTCSGGGFGILKVSLRTNAAGAACGIVAYWMVRYEFAASAIKVAIWGTTGQSVYADVFLQCSTYPRTVVSQIVGSRQFTLIDSNEANDTTSSDKKDSVECYASVEAAATEIHNQAYTGIGDAVDYGSVKYAYTAGTADSATNATNATKATQDADAKDIRQKYVNVYNSNDINSTDNLSATQLASGGFCVGMVNSATDNPQGAKKWLHVISLCWKKGTTSSWISQLAMGVESKDGLWYRTSSGNVSGLAWRRVIDSSNIGSQTVNYAAYAGSATDSTKVAKAGDTMSGDLTFQTSTNDTPDIIFKYGNGIEKMRIWQDNEPTTAVGPLYRIYNKSGSQLYSGRLATAGQIPTNLNQLTNGPGYITSSGNCNYAKGLWNGSSAWAYLDNLSQPNIFGNGKGIILKSTSAWWVTMQPDGNLVVYQNSVAKWSTGTSSQRFKHNIKDMTEERARQILKIRAVTFDWNYDQPYTTRMTDNAGVIAEEVSKVTPDLVVFEDGEDGGQIERRVEYERFTPYLIKMTQMQQNEIDLLKQQVSQQQTEIDLLKEEIRLLKERI